MSVPLAQRHHVKMSVHRGAIAWLDILLQQTTSSGDLVRILGNVDARTESEDGSVFAVAWNPNADERPGDLVRRIRDIVDVVMNETRDNPLKSSEEANAIFDIFLTLFGPWLENFYAAWRGNELGEEA